MAGYEFYYDRVLKNKSMTYRVLGVKFDLDKTQNGESIIRESSNRTLTEPVVILKDAVRNSLQVSVNHGWLYQGNNLIGIKSNYQNWLSSITAQWEQVSESVQNTIEQFFGGVEGTAWTYLQSVASSDYYKVFTGTDVEIPLTFESRLYSRVEDGRYITPMEQLNNINEYFMGERVQVSNENSNSFMFYTAPHGYSGIKTQGFRPEGTLSLYIGRYIRIDHLVLVSYSYTISREVLRIGTEDKGPLYIDVSFQLMPATVFTSDQVQKMLSTETSLNDTTLYSNARKEGN